MTTRPLIGLTGRRKTGSDIIGMPAPLADKQLDIHFSDYARGVIAAGGLPVYLPNDVDPVQLIDRLDGFLLTGGADIEPDRYGAESETDLYPPEPERDEFELALLEGAISGGVPVLGICRGHQLINVHAGGTLHQDVPQHAVMDQAPTTETHEVTFEAGSILGEIYGASVWVNSLHHQTIDTLGPGLLATARAEDGVVEGIEHADLPIVSVQWHPEMMAARDSDPIFAWLAEAAAEVAAH